MKSLAQWFDGKQPVTAERQSVRLASTAQSLGRAVDAGGSIHHIAPPCGRMPLSLTVISYSGRTPPTPVAVTLGEAGGVIGRQPGCDWVLEDPEGHVSKRHCRVDFVSGRYRITDTSTNGVFLNDSTNRIGFGVSAILQDGDRLFIGSYDIAVQISQTSVSAPSAADEDDPFELGRYQET